MSMTDPISEMLTRIRNALKAGHMDVCVQDSKIKREIVRVLQEEGYIKGFQENHKATHPEVKIDLKYYQGQPVIERIDRVSKPGRRVYSNADDLPQVNGGLGIAVVSTSNGVMTAKSAKKAGIGGEVICTVY